MRSKFFAVASFSIIALFLLIGSIQPAAAEADFRFSCADQIYQAFGEELFTAFTKKTGLEPEIYTCSSSTAMERLMNDYADLASSTKKLYYRHQDYGYNEIVFGKDPLVIITNEQVEVDSLSAEQIREIFGGKVENWKEVGGGDHLVATMVPGQHTGAYWNFRTKFMEGQDIRYDFMSYESTKVIRSAMYYPYVISFITRAAISDYEHIKILKVDNTSPDALTYPYHQTFSFVTKGKAEGGPKAFIDFVTQGKGREILKERGVTLMVDKK